jgi:cell division septal protein FtsQ
MDKDTQSDFQTEFQDDFAKPKNSLRNKQRERKLRKKRKKLKSIRTFLKFIIFVVLVLLCYYFFTLPQWYLPKDAYSRANGTVVSVVNNKIVPSYVVYNSLKNTYVPPVPIFLVSVKPIKKELFKIPVFEKIYVRRYGFPARIQIIVKERIPLAVFKSSLNAKPIAFYTLDGVLVTNKNYMGFAQTPNSLKILVNKFDKKVWNIEKVREVEKIIKSVETYSDEKVEYIDFRNQNDIYVKIKSTNIRLGVIDSTIYERIKRIYTILPQIKEYNNQIRYIDLSWDKVNYLKLNK